MINNRDCFFYKKSDFINRLQDISPDSVCYIADTQQIYTHGRYFECNVTQAVVEQLIQNHGYLTAADLPVLTGGASPTPGEYVSGVSVGGHSVNVQKGKLSEINVGTASKLEIPRKIELSGDLSGSIMFDGSQDVNIETIVHNSTTADRLTTPRTISLSSQATGQVSFDGSGNVDIPVTVNELDSKNSNNRDLNSLVTLNGYGGSLFYGIGGNTSVNKPSGVDWFGLFSFKSASGNYTTQILGSNNRLYSRSNADTSLGSWNTIAYLTDNVASATKLQNTRTFTISDGTNSGTASNFDGTGNVTLRLPRTIKANIVGDITGDIIGDVTGDLRGNADTATKLQTGRNINGTLFDGTQNITTAQWGTARNLTIGNSTKSVNGSANVSWSLSEIGAAARSHSHSNYVQKSGDTMTGMLNTCWVAGSWITGKTNAAIKFNGLTPIDSNSAWFLYNMKSASGNVIAFGGLGDNIGFYTYDAARTTNGIDSSFLCNTNTGVWTFSNTPTVNGTSVSLNGHTHSWSSITSKPSWIGSSKPSYSWNEISGKPSSYTPSSHTHPISQITSRGTLRFTGAATGSYDGSGNLTINIPSGGMSSVSWSDISGKPSTFTPSAHTHSASDITSGILALARIPTGTTASTVALGNHTHSGYATQSWVNSQGFIKSATDTKNTAGSTNTSSKLFLIGATSQATSPVTYSNVSVYTISGALYASKMYATDGFYETSDARLKTFGEDVLALNSLSKIPTKYFTWKSDESKTEHIGTSAQEIQKLYPDLVTENEDGVLSVDYTRLSIIALAAIKELKGELDKLKEELNKLKK